MLFNIRVFTGKARLYTQPSCTWPTLSGPRTTKPHNLYSPSAKSSLQRSSRSKKSIDILIDAVYGREKKQRRKKASDTDIALGHAHDWIKAEVARQIVEVFARENLFPSIRPGSSCSTLILSPLDKVMKITCHKDLVEMLNKSVHFDQSALYVVSYIHPAASGRLHDIVLIKLCNAFFSGLPGHNLLSSNARVRCTDKQSFAKRVDDSNEYYRCPDYNMAWNNAFHAALTEYISSGLNPFRNRRLSYPDCEVPSITEFPLMKYRFTSLLPSSSKYVF